MIKINSNQREFDEVWDNSLFESKILKKLFKEKPIIIGKESNDYMICSEDCDTVLVRPKVTCPTYLAKGYNFKIQLMSPDKFGGYTEKMILMYNYNKVTSVLTVVRVRLNRGELTFKTSKRVVRLETLNKEESINNAHI